MDEALKRDVVGEFLAHLANVGWRVEVAGPDAARLPLSEAGARGIPAEYGDLLRRFALLAAPDESRWFLSADDYAGRSDSAFAWNEIELISLNAAVDAADRQRVQEFWAEHLPIAMAVDGCYEYLAINRTDGAVVHGVEPEFEEAAPLAASLQAFLLGVLDGGLPSPFFGDD